MKKKILLNRSVALFLAFCMATVLIPATALAVTSIDDPNSYYFQARAEIADEPRVDPPTYLPAIQEGKNSGLMVEAYNGYKAEIGMKAVPEGNSIEATYYGLTVISEGENAEGNPSKSIVTVDGPIVSGKEAVSVTVRDHGYAEVQADDLQTTATGDGIKVDAEEGTVKVTAGEINAKGTGADIFATSGAGVEVETGKITAGGDGVTVEASDNVSVKVQTGALTANGKGINLSADSGANLEVNAGGAVNAGENGVFIYADGDGTQVVISAEKEINGNQGVEIKSSDGALAGGIVGNVNASGKDAFGVSISTEQGSASGNPVVIPNDLDAISVYTKPEDGNEWHTVPEESEDSEVSSGTVLDTDDVTAYAGVHVEAAGGTSGISTGKVTVTGGNIEDSSKPITDRFANGFIATNGGMVIGDLESVESKACGVDLYIRSAGIATVNAGSIKADEIGIHIDNEGGTTWTDADTITSYMEAVGVTMVGDESVSFAFVDGNATSTHDNGIEISNQGGHVLVAVAGDATSTADDPNLEKSAGLEPSGSPSETP